MINLTYSDLIHFITLYPLIQKYFESNKSILIDNSYISKLLRDPILKTYLEYCMNAYTPDKRNYDLLRSVLMSICKNSSSKIVKAVKNLISDQTINTIIDVGAGHSEYSKILKNIFPEAKITLLDKNDINAEDFNLIICDAEKYFTTRFKGNSETLIFMSEFLHCKKENLDLLDNLEIRKCHILINELEYNPFINYRLNMTGGILMKNPLILYHKLGYLSFSKYQSELFRYNMYYYHPLINDKKI